MYICILQGDTGESGPIGDEGEPGEVGSPGEKVTAFSRLHSTFLRFMLIHPLGCPWRPWV